jgi:hypothetical protein
MPIIAAAPQATRRMNPCSFVSSQKEKVMSGRKSQRIFDDKGAFWMLIQVVFVGLISIIIYAFQAWNITGFISIATVGIMIAGASLLVGGFVGFLFGIPRTLQQDLPLNDEQDSRLENRLQGASYQANTNLEQISDWLTKILVGVGLTQLSTIFDTLQRIADSIEIGLGGFPSSKTLALAILVYFPICGFLLGYLWTRLFLASAFKQAELGMRDLLKKVIGTLFRTEVMLPDGDRREVQEFRQGLEKQLGLLSKERQQVSKQSDKLNRWAMSQRGAERTATMSNSAGEIRALAWFADYSFDDIKKIYEKGTTGDRIVALSILQVNPNREGFELALTSIKDPMGPNEQYEALRLIESWIDSLTSEQKQQVKSAIEGQQYIIPENRSRWEASQQILVSID